MSKRLQAEDHLRVIRSLMERATIYRAVSAPAAAIGGILSVLASFAFGNWFAPLDPLASPRQTSVWEFAAVWLAVLVLTACANTWFLYREARRRGDLFVSPGMKVALRALLPSLALAGGWSAVLVHYYLPAMLVPLWIGCYGLGLLATRSFAPRSLGLLGWAFVIAAVPALHVCLLNRLMIADVPLDGEAFLHAGTIRSAQAWMACTFGLFHLAYAAFTWPRRKGSEESDIVS